MKKQVLFSAAMVAAIGASAQTGEITSNRGENWLSQSGDWGLTFDAQPLLNYVGNLFNNGTNNMQTVWLLPNGATGNNNLATNGITIGGKKLIDANTAYRGKVRIGFGNNKTTDLVPTIPQPSGATQVATVEDVTTNSFFGLTLGAGLEKRVGSTRVVGVYGGEFMVGLGSSRSTTEYGNAISNDNQVTRVTETKNGSTFGLGLNAFAGIEWFCAPKLSLSGEYTWGLALTSTGTSEQTTESWNGTSVVSTTVEGDPDAGTVDRSSSFSLDTGVSGLSIGLNFYFQ
jgi:hypothetical protein